jgi:hypothetical protein
MTRVEQHASHAGIEILIAHRDSLASP